jgi:hypothetical protein
METKTRMRLCDKEYLITLAPKENTQTDENTLNFLMSIIETEINVLEIDCNKFKLKTPRKAVRQLLHEIQIIGTIFNDYECLINEVKYHEV